MIPNVGLTLAGTFSVFLIKCLRALGVTQAKARFCKGHDSSVFWGRDFSLLTKIWKVFNPFQANFPFYTPWKHRFLMFSKGYIMAVLIYQKWVNQISTSFASKKTCS